MVLGSRKNRKRIATACLAVWAFVVTLPLPMVHRHDEVDQQATMQLAVHWQLRHEPQSTESRQWHLHWVWLQQAADEGNSQSENQPDEPVAGLQDQALLTAGTSWSTISWLDRFDVLPATIVAWPAPGGPQDFVAPVSGGLSGRILLQRLSVLRC